MHLSKSHLSFCKSALTDAAADRVSARGDRGREGLRGWISYIFPRELWQEEKRKGGCELISRYIVGCHFYSNQKKAPNSPSDPSSLPRAKHTIKPSSYKIPLNQITQTLYMIRLMFKPTNKSVCVIFPSLPYGLSRPPPPPKQTNKRNPPLFIMMVFV